MYVCIYIYIYKNPGEVLYVPAGAVHSIWSEEEAYSRVEYSTV